MPEKKFNVQFSSQVYHVACMSTECEKQLCNIHIKILNGKKSNKKGVWLWRPSAYVISVILLIKVPLHQSLG